MKEEESIKLTFLNQKLYLCFILDFSHLIHRVSYLFLK